jgi:hypothetical protein
LGAPLVCAQTSAATLTCATGVYYFATGVYYLFLKHIWPVALTHAVNENEIQIQILKTWEIFEFFHLLRDNLHRE